MLVCSTKICQFTQEDLESDTTDVFGPNGGRALSVSRVAMNWSNEDFWSSAESLQRKKKKKKIWRVLLEVAKLTGKVMNEFWELGKLKRICINEKIVSSSDVCKLNASRPPLKM